MQDNEFNQRRNQIRVTGSKLEAALLIADLLHGKQQELAAFVDPPKTLAADSSKTPKTPLPPLPFGVGDFVTVRGWPGGVAHEVTRVEYGSFSEGCVIGLDGQVAQYPPSMLERVVKVHASAGEVAP